MRVAFAAGLMLGVTAACRSSGPGASQGCLADSGAKAKLRDLALQVSSSDGVPSPKAVTAVCSPDREAAEKVVSGDVVDDHSPVYVVEVTGGTFTDSNASGPPGSSLPHGSALTLTVNQQTFEVTDMGITDSAPDLTQISPDVVSPEP